MNEDEKYTLGKAIGLVGGFFFIVWVIGYVEWYMKWQHGGTAKERYEKQLLAGFMRGVEIWAKVVTVLWVIALVLFILLGLVGVLV